jgi:uncharacterized protein (DUF58 family)
VARAISQFLSPEELGRLERLTLQSRYVVEGTLAGRHRSPMRGASSEFADHRAYIAGDDPKKLDWKVLGRTDRYYVRRYEDETILRVYLVVDRSASMGFGSGERTKYEAACRLAAALGYVTVKERDAVGLYLYAVRIDVTVPPRNSMVHLNAALQQLGRYGPALRTETAKTLHQIAEAIQRRALIVLISDLLDDEQEIIRALAHFRMRHHDVIVFHTLDPRELDLAFPRGGRFEDLETAEGLVADPRALAAGYRQVFGEFLDQYRRRCSELNVDYRLVDISQPVEPFVRAYLEERQRLSK